MEKIAVIKTGGKQYKVGLGQVLKIEKLNSEVGEKTMFEALMIADAEGVEVNVGKPSLGEKVEGKILEQGKNKKVSVIKYKNKTRYKKNVGHRQPFTKIEITSIS